MLGATDYIVGTPTKCRVSSFCSSLSVSWSFSFPGQVTPLCLFSVPCSVSAVSWPVLPERVSLFHLSQVSWLFKLAGGGRGGLRVAEAEGVGKKVEKLLYSSKAVSFIK